MGQILVRLETPAGPRYMLWCEVMDAPVTPLMSREFIFRRLLDDHTIEDARHRVDRADYAGTTSAEEIIRSNSAGPGMTHLTQEEIIEQYMLPAAVLDGRVSFKTRRGDRELHPTSHAARAPTERDA